MISAEEAKLRNEQLHPAFAGYLHDGHITSRDILATLLHLMKGGALMPHFEDNSMNKRIIKIQRMSKQPQLPFEKQLLDDLFKGETIISTDEVGKRIQDNRFAHTVKKTSPQLRFFPLLNHK